MSSQTADKSESRKPRRRIVEHYRGPKLDLAAHPDAPDPVDLAGVRRWIRAQSSNNLTALDLFCGAGGLSLGLENAGFKVLVGADIDPASVATHVANIGGLGYQGDLSDPEDFLDHLNAWGVRKVDLIAGGVPCQPFSRAGRSKIRSLVDAGQRSADDPRAQMWRSFIDVVEELAPNAVLLENVPDLAAWDEGGVLVGFCESLRQLGYKPRATILNAYEHGVPQHRSRLFIVALKPGAQFDWPRPQSGSPTVRQAIGDLPVVAPAQRQEQIPYRGPRTRFQRLMRTGVPDSDRRIVFDHITRDIRPDDAEAFALLPEGGTYEQLPARLQRYRADIFSDKYKRLEWNGLSRSITAHLAKDGYWYIHPDQDRTLSVREAARIQTFPDWFRFSGQPSLRYRQIGNAVPPLLAQTIAASVHLALTQPRRRGRPRTSGEAFRTRLLAWHADHPSNHPWREEVDPWSVLVGEVCLSRSRAEEVPEVYEALSMLAPTPATMVANAEDALDTMRSLGLGSRADTIISIARVLVDEHAGAVPSSDLELRELPGVGDRVANTVMAFGFGRRTVVVDSNTQRIIGRVCGREKTPRWQLRLDLHELAGSEGPDPAFNSALLDFGARICQAGTPLCDDCPVRRHCSTRGAVVAAQN